MLSLTSLPLVAAALTLGISSPTPLPESARCSPVPFPWVRDATVTYLLGTATADTVRAGPGAVDPGDDHGHRGRGDAREIHGQRVRVERFGGADSTTLAAAFPDAANREVVIVPWNYDPACRATHWSRSARWIPLEQPGMFIVRLRPPGHWADGIPTFDAFMADLKPYPHGVFFDRGHRGTGRLRTEPSLTAAEYFELYRALPDHALIRSDPAAAAARLDAWVRAHPDAATRYPAPEILGGVRRETGRS